MLHCVVVDHTNIPNFKEVSPVSLCDIPFAYPNIEMMGYFNFKKLTLTVVPELRIFGLCKNNISAWNSSVLRGSHCLGI